MDKKLLAILCCPVSYRELLPARADLLKSVNAAISDGALKNRDGETLASDIDAALVTDDGRTLYPVADGIPVLLEGEGIDLQQLDKP